MDVTTDEPILVVTEDGQADVTTVNKLVEEVTDNEAVESIAPTLDDVQTEVQQIADTVERIEENQHTEKDDDIWLRQQITDLATQISTAVQAIAALQTTVTELLLTQNTVIQDVVLQLRNSSNPMKSENESNREPSTTPPTQQQELEVLENAESVTAALTEAVVHPVVSHPPGKAKINWI